MLWQLEFIMYLHCVSSDSDSRQTLTQRERELVESADKCHETMENQMADLRKQCSSLEQEIASAKEDNKSFQQQLRDKVSLNLRWNFVIGNTVFSLAYLFNGPTCLYYRRVSCWHWPRALVGRRLPLTVSPTSLRKPGSLPNRDSPSWRPCKVGVHVCMYLCVSMNFMYSNCCVAKLHISLNYTILHVLKI